MAEVIAELVGKLSFEVDGKGLKDFNQGLEKTEEKTKEAGVGTIAFGNIIADLAGGVANATVEVLKFGASLAKDLVADFVESGTEIDKWSKTIGVGVEELQRLEFAGKSVGAEADNMREAVKTLRENLGEMSRVGSGPAVDALGTLGIELSEIQDLGATEQLQLFATALNELPDDSERLSVALEVLGEDGRALLPLFQEGASGIAEMTARADELGVVLDQEAIDKAKATGDAVRELEAQMEAAGNTIAGALAPQLTELARGAGEWIQENEKLIEQDIPAFIEDVVVTGAAAVEWVIDFADDVKFLGQQVGFLTEAIGEGLTDALEALEPVTDTVGAGIQIMVDLLSDAVAAIEAIVGKFESARALAREIQVGLGLDDAPTTSQRSAPKLASQKAGGRTPEALSSAEINEAIQDPQINEATRKRLAAQLPKSRKKENAAIAAAAEAALAENFAAANSALDANRAKLQADERAKRRGKFKRKAKGVGGGGKEIDTSEAEDLLGPEIGSLAAAAGVGQKAIDQALTAAAKSLKQGASSGVALAAATSQIQRLSGVKLDSTGGADAALFGLLTQIGGPQAARSATEGARFVRIDQSQNNTITIEVPERFGEAMTAPGMAEDFAAALRPILTGEYQQVIDRFAGGVEP